MKALLLRKYLELELTDIPKPEPAAGQVLIRVKACGICGSDIHGFDGSSGRRIPPIVMGHEASGIVAATGSGVRGIAEGDRVTFDSTISCGDCFFCRRGRINLCDNRQILGVSCGDFRRDGAFAEYVTVPHHIVYKLPDSLPFEVAAAIEPVSVAVHAVNITPIMLGDTAVVVGTGMVGLLVLQALKLGGCGRVIAVDIDDAKLNLARQLGASECVNSSTTDAPTFVRDLTDGRGADIAVEVVGATAPLQTALASIRKGGVLTMVGNITPKIELPLQSVVTREIKLLGSCVSAGEYPACIDLLARGAIRFDPLISAVAPLEQGPAWFKRLYAKEPNLMKVVLQP